MPPARLRDRIDGVPESATLAINERSAALQAQGRSITRFGLGQSPFPVPNSVVSALREHAAEKDYLPVAGLEALRKAVAGHHRRVDGLEARAEEVLIGPGSKELMFILQVVLDAELVVPAASWVSYLPQARIAQSRAHVIPTNWENRWRLSPESLDAHCRETAGKTQLLILNYPGNPDGLTYSAGQLSDLADVARAHEVVVLSDEIYGPLHHAGSHTSLARFYPEGTLVSGGLSKWCGAGGWRLGTLLFPPPLEHLRKAAAVMASETFTSVCAPVQYAAVTAFEENNEIEDYLLHARRILSCLGGWCARTLNEAGVRVHAPEGGFYLLMDFAEIAHRLREAGIRNGRHLCEEILSDTGVALLPGEDFNRPQDELTARMAYVAFDGDAALKRSVEITGGAPLDPEALEASCAPTFEGVRRLVDWLNSPGASIAPR